MLEDVFGSRTALDAMIERLARGGRGVVVYLRENSVGVAESSRRAARCRQAADSSAARGEEWREVGVGAQILRDLGVKSIKLIASRERRYVGLDGFGIEIDSTDTV